MKALIPLYFASILIICKTQTRINVRLSMVTSTYQQCPRLAQSDHM